jgi:hypothetical protein
MTNLGEYITIKDAANLTNKSVITIRRFVARHKDVQNDIVRLTMNARHRPLYKINKTYLLSYFELSKMKKRRAGISTAKDACDNEDHLNRYLYYKRTYILTNKYLKFIISSSLIFLVALAGIFLNYKHLLSLSYEKDVTFLGMKLKLQENQIKKLYKKDDEQEKLIVYLYQVIERQASISNTR